MEGLLKGINIVAEKLGISVDSEMDTECFQILVKMEDKKFPISLSSFGGEKISRMVQ